MDVRRCLKSGSKSLLCGLVSTLAFSLPATAQSVVVPLPFFASPQPPGLSPRGECLLLSVTMCKGLPPDVELTNDNRADSSSSSSRDPDHHGALRRGANRILQDQEQIWTAPFKASNLKWDAGVLLVTGALIATDRQTVPGTSQQAINTSGNISDGAIYGIGTTAGVIWIAGLLKDNPHQKETGLLTLEALTDAMPVYTILQVLAGRERPGEGTGNGRFWQRHSVDGSFPGGHAMFSWTMAAVIAHEYPRWWVKTLLYGAAATVSVTRFTAHDHFASDTFVGTALGYFIGRHIFHARCNPDYSEACRR